MPKVSAGIVLYRRGGLRDGQELEVFLVHPGGPFWAKKDAGAWSIPKGEYDASPNAGEDALAAARREFEEEIGAPAPGGEAVLLGEVKQAGGKIVRAWAIEGDCDAEAIYSNLFEMEWPPKSGRMQEFPEVDRAGWFTVDEAREKLLKSQHEFLARLERVAGSRSGEL